MGFLDKAGDFETAINREGLHYRSKRLDAVVQAIADYVIGGPTFPKLEAIDNKFAAWKKQDPKEFSNRGRKIEAQLRYEMGMKGASHWGLGVPRIIDPAAHPVYEPARWNDNADIQFSTNCYAYACNDSANHPINAKPQPGQLAGKAVRQAEDFAVRYAVMRDDMERGYRQLGRLVPLIRLDGEGIPDAVNVPGYYLIALITAPGADYHWVRQDRNGMWSHKPGWGVATDRDSLGKRIHDPRDATITIPIGRGRVMKYEFTTFYYAPRGGVRTGELGNLPPQP